MAATATITGSFAKIGAGGFKIETGKITFDSDATVEVPTRLTKIFGFTATQVGSGGQTVHVSLDETLTDGALMVSNGAFTVDATSNNTATVIYQVIGW